MIRKNGLYAVKLIDGKIVILRSYEGELFTENDDLVLPSIVTEVYIDSYYTDYGDINNQ